MRRQPFQGALLTCVGLALALLLACDPRARRPASADAASWSRLVAALQLIADEHHEALELEQQEDRQRRLQELATLLEAASLPVERSDLPAALKTELASLRPRVLSNEWELGGPLTALANKIVAWARLANTPPGKPDLIAGKNAYARACAACHGSDGSGRPELTAMDPPPVNILRPQVNLTPYEFFNRVTYGGAATAMPSFEEGLTVAERWDIVFFLFAERWPPCRKALPAISSDELALSGDFELGNKFGYGAAACLRRTFLAPTSR